MTEQMDYESLYALYQSCLDSNAHMQHELERLTDELAKYQWQPIETAPEEDGARVLLFGYVSNWAGGADFKQPIIRCGRRQSYLAERTVPVEGTEFFKKEQYQYLSWMNDETYLTDNRLMEPTHWMPLPNAPKAP